MHRLLHVRELATLALSMATAFLMLATPGASAAETTPITLVFNSSVQAELHDCGCKSKPLGGLARRAAKIESIRAEHDHVLLLDAGNLMAKSGPAAVEQSRFVASETARMGYEVLGVGPYDLGHGIEALYGVAASSQLRFVSANLAQDGDLLFAPYEVVEVGGVRVGITSVYDPALHRAPWTGKIDGLEVRDPVTALRNLLPELRSVCDLVVLYSNLNNGSTPELIRTLGDEAGIDLAIEGYAPSRFASLKKVGSTNLLAANDRGKYVGQVDLLVDAEGIVDAVYELHELTLKMPEDETVARRVADFEEHRKSLARSR